MQRNIYIVHQLGLLNFFKILYGLCISYRASYVKQNLAIVSECDQYRYDHNLKIYMDIYNHSSFLTLHDFLLFNQVFKYFNEATTLNSEISSWDEEK